MSQKVFGSSRRAFLKASAAGTAAAAGLVLPEWFGATACAEPSKNDRPLLGVIGCGDQGMVVCKKARPFGDIAAVCDVHRQRAERLKAQWGPTAEIYDDYRKLLERKDLDAILIATPDHWHTTTALRALQAGKHVYLEKPLSLTIDEGKLLVKAVQASGKVMQVGTMQRSNMLQFARAVITARSGQLGKIQRVSVLLPGNRPEGGPFATQPVPEGLNWDYWLGQAPKVDYCPERCHGTFRWWYEYSGGMMTDWGAHYVDIAHWALDCEQSGPLTIDGSKTKLPNIPNGYNTAKTPIVNCEYANGVQMEIITGEPHGVIIEGDKGRIFVNRLRLAGKPIEAQDADPKLKQSILDEIPKLFRGNKMGNHMGNFFEAFRNGKHPISDVVSQHRVATACHLANISIRLGRKIAWDPVQEQIVGDDQANAWLKREQRKGYEVPV